MVGESLLSAAFDVVLSISSFEHDGLGRYGDPLNPDGDLAAMRSTRRLLKPGAKHEPAACLPRLQACFVALSIHF
jgi:hypothetical protein